MSSEPTVDVKVDTPDGKNFVDSSSIESKPQNITDLKKFVDDRQQSETYLKLLAEEVTQLHESQTRHAYTVWVLIGVSFVVNQRLGALPFIPLDRVDRSLLMKTLPAAIAFYYYVTVSRTFMLREVGSMYHHLLSLLYPSEHYPLADYISRGSFMRTEKFLHQSRPQSEMLGYILFLGVMATAIMWGPVVASFYFFYLALNEFPVDDPLLQISVVVGIVFMTQALIILRGNILMVNSGIGRMRLNIQPMFVLREGGLFQSKKSKSESSA